ncbi:MAG: DNA repair protein RadA [Bacteroidales bacterium]|nr:DNA repair protein RadA [Bacteroidales bacterium]
MAKEKTAFFCRECGAKSAVWIGRCPQCGAWNSYEQEVIHREKSGGLKNLVASKSVTMLMSSIECSNEQRIDLKDEEINRVLGGGLVLGSLVLMGGEPGIGKSTLLLQIALNCKDKRVLYVSGEESANQIKMRAERINKENGNCYVLTETCVEEIVERAKEVQPQIVIIDSIQTMTTCDIDSSAGSISQIRESTARLALYAKQTSTPIILVGHITKDGSLAGPKILEHMVDTVLQFEGERNYGYRIVRSIKNRFGSTQELGIYEMLSYGLKQVSNPSEILMSNSNEELSGTAIAATIEGNRPLFIETQALVANSYYSSAQKNATGFDLRRLSMLLAVLEKRVGVKIGGKDIFLNIVGGLKVADPAIDLAVVAGLISSGEDIAINRKHCFAAEIGLSGELRGVVKIEQRINEAAKLGFERIYIAKSNSKHLSTDFKNIEVVALGKIDELLPYILR